MEIIDPHNSKKIYLNWKERVKEGIPELTKENSDILKQYLFDMESGVNVCNSAKKGSRSFTRLNCLKNRLMFVFKKLETKHEIKIITQAKEEIIHSLFLDMRNGVITRKDGLTFKSPEDYAKDFKAFWHWWQKVNRKKGVTIEDITIDLDISGNKPEWVYLTEEEVKKICDNAKYEYRVLIMFLFDTGIRAPTELMNVRISDLYNDFKELQIREDSSKTFGRRIKLMLTPEIIREYVKNKKLTSNDVLFDISPTVVNRYLQRLTERLFGDKKSPAGEKYSNLTMYDFRHCSCCYWLPRYKSESALKYRFGWKKSDKIHYYSELLGMRDTINEEDMLVDVTKTDIEHRLEKSENEKEIIQERLANMEKYMEKVMAMAEKMQIAINV